MPLRRTIFWIHLISGIVAGLVIAIMSITGIAIAFEAEILAAIDSEISHVSTPEVNATALPIGELRTKLAQEQPDFKATAVQVFSDPGQAYQFLAGRTDLLYANQYTGEFSRTKAHGAHDFLHMLEDWHRWLGMAGEGRSTGRLITGVSNLAFLLLCISGLYLWFPKVWKWRFFRPILWFKKSRKSKARDFNWHNVFGFWNIPILVILAGTAAVISFGWAHDLVFKLSGEEPPQYRDFRMLAVAPPAIPEHPQDAAPASLDAIYKNIVSDYPNWQRISINLPKPSLSPELINAAVYLPALFNTKGYTPLAIDPIKGNILQAIPFEDRSGGLKARVWIRFLHTGEAFGLFGKIIATLGTLSSLILIYTGFALSWRRFLSPMKTPSYRK